LVSDARMGSIHSLVIMIDWWHHGSCI